MTASDDELIARLEFCTKLHSQVGNPENSILFGQAAARLRSLSESKREMVEALEPFAAWIDAVDTNPNVQFPDDATINAVNDQREIEASITGADFRRARAALASLPDRTGEPVAVTDAMVEAAYENWIEDVRSLEPPWVEVPKSHRERLRRSIEAALAATPPDAEQARLRERVERLTLTLTDNDKVIEDLHAKLHAAEADARMWESMFTENAGKAAAAVVRSIDAEARLAQAERATAVTVTRTDILREWFGGERYARDHEYLDWNFGLSADAVVSYLAALAEPQQAVTEDAK